MRNSVIANKPVKNLTVLQFAERLNISPSTAWRMVYSKDILSFKARGNRRIPATEAERVEKGDKNQK